MSSPLHRVYGRLRPIFYRLGVLKLARRLLSQETRYKLATWFGLGGFDVFEHRGYYIPQRTRLTGIAFDGVNFIGDMAVPFGTGEAARQLVKAIEAANIPVKPVQITLTYARDESPTDGLELKAEDAVYNVNIVHVNPPEIPHLLESSVQHIVRDRYLIAYWHWELDTFPEKWEGILDFFDEVWVASHFIRKTLEPLSSVPVRRIPIPVTITESTRSDLDVVLPEGRFIYLTLFAPLSGIERKNPFGAIEAFKRAFAGIDHNALLVVKTHQLDSIYGRAVKAPLRKAIREVGGILVDETLERSQIDALIARCDCLISLHRSEGFGLPIAEAMALGKPVVCTAYSGNMDFTTGENSYLVNYSLREIRHADHDYFPPMAQIYQIGKQWAEPDLDHAAQLIHDVYTNRDEANTRGKQARQTIHNKLSYETVGQVIHERLTALGHLRD